MEVGVEASLVLRGWGVFKISSEFHLSDEEKYLVGQEESVFNLNWGERESTIDRTDTEGGMDVWIERKIWDGGLRL